MDGQGNVHKKVSKKSLGGNDGGKYLELIEQDEVDQPQELEFESEASEVVVKGT